MIRVKQSFTLIELIIVIILISSTYFLIFSNSNFTIKNQDEKISLENLREYLITNFNFEYKVEFICISDDLKCYVKVDDILQEDFEIVDFFEIKPEIYEYSKDLELIEYGTVNINNINEDIIFLYFINNDYKSNEFILDTLNNNVYIFNSIFKDVEIFSSLDEVLETFNFKQIEVQDAF